MSLDPTNIGTATRTPDSRYVKTVDGRNARSMVEDYVCDLAHAIQAEAIRDGRRLNHAELSARLNAAVEAASCKAIVHALAEQAGDDGIDVSVRILSTQERGWTDVQVTR